MRTQCCIACCSLPALLLTVAVLGGFLLLSRASPPLATVWQDTPAGIQAEVLTSREVVRLEFPETRKPPGQDERPYLLWAQRMDEYGRFQRASRSEDEAAWVPMR